MKMEFLSGYTLCTLKVRRVCNISQSILIKTTASKFSAIILSFLWGAFTRIMVLPSNASADMPLINYSVLFS